MKFPGGLVNFNNYPNAECINQTVIDQPANHHIERWAKVLGKLAYDAMMEEVLLTPKPGLVDQRNSGAHRDMDKETFKRSALAIADYMPEFVRAGYALGHIAPQLVLPQLRSLGIACERAMFQTTDGVNTHKGAVFAFGLLCAAAGRLLAGKKTVAVMNLSNEVAAICQGMVERELGHNRQRLTAGERIYHAYGFTGARGEAESGFLTVLELSLPTYLTYRQAGWDNESSLLQTLLLLMSCNSDTNLVSRGGLEGLEYVKNAARDILLLGGCKHHQSIQWMTELDEDLIDKNLSPGGSADLLAVTWFLAHLPEESACFDA